MAARNTPRAKVRLRLDKGTLLLRQFGITSIMCAIADLSEAGCQCVFSMTDLDQETTSAWREIIQPGRVLTVELTEPPELRNLIFREAQVRWVKQNRNGDMNFGLLFSAVDKYQSEILSNALIAFAQEKLRARKASEALTKTMVKPLPSVDRAPQPTQLESLPPSPVPPPPRPVTPSPASHPTPIPNAPQTAAASRLTVTRVRRGYESETGAHPPAGEARPPTGQHSPVPGSSERQKRQQIYMSALLEFCDSRGARLETDAHQGRTIDLNEGGFKVEAPASMMIAPEALIRSGAHAYVTIRGTNKDVRSFCAIKSVAPSPNISGFWTYGLQILDITDEDRRQLRELYIRAGLTHISRRPY